MFKNIVLITVLFLFSVSIQAQETKPKSADIIMKIAMKQSKASHKNIMVMFHASWCSWCKRLDKAMQSPELKQIFEENFVITHLDVLERKGKIDSLENAGGQDLMKTYGGEKAGLPFCVIVDKSGKMIANSNAMPDKSNIGYPGSKEEVDLFVKLLKSGSKKLSKEKAAKITDYFIKNAPKQAGSASN